MYIIEKPIRRKLVSYMFIFQLYNVHTYVSMTRVWMWRRVVYIRIRTQSSRICARVKNEKSLIYLMDMKNDCSAIQSHPRELIKRQSRLVKGPHTRCAYYSSFLRLYNSKTEVCARAYI